MQNICIVVVFTAEDVKIFSLAYRNDRYLPRILNVLFTWKVKFEKKIPLLPIQEFPSLALPCRNVKMTTAYYPIHALLGCPMVAYAKRSNTKENFKLFALKVVAVLCER